MTRVLMIKFIHLDFQSKLSTFEFKNSPRNLINAWESHAISILEERGLDRSLEEISTLMKDDAVDLEVQKASKILFWIKIWRQSKTKEEVVVSWSNIVDEISHSKYGKNNYHHSNESKPHKERVDLPAIERIKELLNEGLSPEEVILRGFSFKKVTEVLKDGT